MQKVIDYQQNLVKRFNYQKLTDELSKKSREFYFKHLPTEFNIIGSNEELITLNGTLISKGYQRIVIGDYGAFIEFSKEQAIIENMKVQDGEEYRLEDEKYNVKYFWLTAIDDSGIKIYHQKRKVSYADYLPDMYYVSPYEVSIRNNGTFDFLNI